MKTYKLAELKKAIKIAANDLYENEIVETLMEENEMESLGYLQKESFREDWIEDKIREWIEKANNET